MGDVISFAPDQTALGPSGRSPKHWESHTAGTPAASAARSQRRIGIVINPRSHANEAKPLRLDLALRRYPGLLAAAPTDPAALLTALKTFATEAVDLLVISGGDGTVRDVLSALPFAYSEPLPEIAILSAGNTNLTARALGSAGGGQRALNRLLKAIRNDRVRRVACPMLEVSWPGQPMRTPVRGFLFGAGAITQAKSLADAKLHRRGVHQGLAVWLAVAATAAQAMLARGGEMIDGTPMRIGIDTGPPQDGLRFLVLATTLNRLMLGLWPFWGHGRSAIHWLDVDAPPRRLGAALRAILWRRPREWMPANGYRSGKAYVIRLRLGCSFMLDGDLFDPGPEGITLVARHGLTVVSP